MCKQKSFRSKRKSNKRGGYSLLVLLFLKSKSTGTKASYYGVHLRTKIIENKRQFEV